MDVKGSERVGRLEEGIDVLRAVWSGPAAHEGTYWSFPELDLEPKPVQQPCPVWLASNPDPIKLSRPRYQAAIDRVGRLADGWLSTVVSPDGFGRRWNEIRESALKAGRNPRQMSSALHLMINLHPDPEIAREQAKRFLDTYYSTDVKPDVMDMWGAYGPPEQVAARIGEYLDQGLDLPILRFASFDQKGQMEWALTELLPLLVAM